MRIRRADRWLTLVAWLVGCAAAPRPARYLYVWAGTGHPPTQAGTDFIAVLDADPASRSGVWFDRATWPNGLAGMAMPHAALFVPSNSAVVRFRP